MLTYRSPKHEVTRVTPAKLYFAQDLKLPVDLLRRNPPETIRADSVEGYLEGIRKKLEEIHESARKRMDIKSSRTKTWYDQKARQIHFEVGQKVWFYNSRRTKGRTPKLQNSWEGLYQVVKKLSDVVYYIRKSNKCKNKIVHINRLASYFERCLGGRK